MSKDKADAWTLFLNMFKKGDEVIVVTEFDTMDWGRLKDFNVFGCRLSKRGVGTIFLDWDEIRFMAHDGFPCLALKGADGSSSIEKLDTEKVQKQIRKLISSDGYGFLQRPKKIKRIVFSDPFMIEDVIVELFNVGKEWEEDGMNEYEETIVCRTKEGCGGLLYDISSIYFYEAA